MTRPPEKLADGRLRFYVRRAPDGSAPAPEVTPAAAATTPPPMPPSPDAVFARVVAFLGAMVGGEKLAAALRQAEQSPSPAAAAAVLAALATSDIDTDGVDEAQLLGILAEITAAQAEERGR